MEKRFVLLEYGEHLWMRENGRRARQALEKQMDTLDRGSAMVIDARGVEVFDFSFASEFFGKALLAFPREYPDLFLMVENLNDYTRENLTKTLEGMGLAMIERRKGKLNLIGKVHPADLETFRAVEAARSPVSSNQVREKLGINLTAANERLSKLAGMGIVRRIRGTSTAGRERYEYSVPL